MRIKFISVIVLVIGMSACHSGSKDGKIDETGGIYAAIASNPQEIVVGKDQFEAGAMKIGRAEQTTFSQYVHANAYVEPSPDAVSVVSSSLPGKVDGIFVAEGDVVKVGEVLFSIKGREIIEIQQAYAEAHLEYGLLKANYQRQKKLDESKIGATKDLLKAEADMKMAQTRVESLRAQLSLLHIDVKRVEEGKISEKISVRASIQGTVSSMDISLGSIVDSDVELMRIVDPSGLRLEIHVFEKDLDLLMPEQIVHVVGKGNYIQEKTAILKKVGVEIAPETRSVTCIAELDKKDSKAYVMNQFVEVNIVICKREVKAISEDALVLEDGRYYVLVKEREDDDQIIFRKKQVEIGVIQNGMAELLAEEDLGDLLVDGGYIMPGE